MANAIRRWDSYKVSFSEEQLTRMLANVDCVGCQILSNAWRLYADEDGRNEKLLLELTRTDGIVIRLRKISNLRVKSVIEAFTMPGMPRLENVRVARLFPESTEPEHSLPLIRDWLADCSSNHDACNHQSLYVPPRLLDVRGDGTNIRLVENGRASGIEEEQRGVRYACLSHCWGSFRPKQMLTRSNIDTNKQSIAIEELPATFQQAIGLCRELGVGYLWIDSLNIVQDSDEDWKYHVTEMRKIYQHAYVTLAAAASADDTGGLFRTNTMQNATGSKMDFAYQDTSYEVNFRTRPDMKDNCVGQAPLLSRGWVMQERLLSRRFILFCRNELIWECRQSVWCSCSINPFVPSLSQPSINTVDRLAHEDPKVVVAALSGLPLRSRYYQWHQVLKLYSRCGLTKSNDKLPAIAGLARLFKDELDDEYVAGLWRRNLHADIAWFIDFDKRSSEGMRLRKGPSWVWPSAGDGSIRYMTLNETGTYQINDVSIQRCDGDELDYLESGTLTICGILFAVSVEFSSPSALYATSGMSWLPTRCRVQDAHLQNDNNSTEEQERGDLRRGHFLPDYVFWNKDGEGDYNGITDGDTAQADGDLSFVFTILFLGISSRHRLRHSSDHPDRVNGLILREKKDTGRLSGEDQPSVASDELEKAIRKFERVGYLYYHIQEGYSIWKATQDAKKTTFQLV